MSRFYLVRHGETVWNKQSRYQGQSNVPLSDTGRMQAKILSRRLENEAIDLIYASDLDRAIETANIIAEPHDLEVVCSKSMRELGFGIWEGLTYDEIINKWPESMKKWQNDPLNVKPPNGETLAELMERTSDFLMAVAKNHPDKTILIATHAGPIRAILSVLLDLKWEFFWKFKISNTSLTIIDYDGSAHLQESDAFIVTINDTYHLQIENSRA